MVACGPIAGVIAVSMMNRATRGGAISTNERPSRTASAMMTSPRYGRR